ncbi:unnamed protein product [Tuber aestivum]|uniref:G domain-containing protein n=1 Tax=Tuber aestivum TaxID=59557 RepID=A0A292Q9W4_9PEZI|nr:unnamed protein product [Tuber aestivum]
MTRKLVKEVVRKEERQETDQNIMSENQRTEREEENLKQDMSEVNETDGFESIERGDYPAELQNGGGGLGELTLSPHDRVGSDDNPAETENVGGAAGEPTPALHDKAGSDDNPAEPQNGGGAAGEHTPALQDRVGSSDGHPAEPQHERRSPGETTPPHHDVRVLWNDGHPAEPQDGRGSAGETTPAPHNGVESGDYPEGLQYGEGAAGKPTPALRDRARNFIQRYATKPPALIAVMGKTGTGKTSFINAITGGGLMKTPLTNGATGTQDIQTARTTINGREVWLIDTPGFDDTNRSDVDILSTIAEWVKQASHERQHLSGIIYFHRIADPRMEGSNMKNLKMFRELCGEKNFNNVVLLTTMWDKVSEEDGQKREDELKSRAGFWGNLISRGAQVKRHRGPDFTTSARDIAQPLIEKDTIVLKLQDELDRNSSLSDTSAGRYLTGEIEAIKRQHQGELEALKAELKDTSSKEEIKLLRECYQKEIQALKKATDDLEKLRAEDRRNFQQKIAGMQKQLDDRGGCIIS